MKKKETLSVREIKALMRERLSKKAPVGLDLRTEEEPEDLFVRLCSRGRQRDVVWALKTNLCEVITEQDIVDKAGALRFMRRAIRLCDTIGAYECKADLKYILLHDHSRVWGNDFRELQELSARALDGMPKEDAEFEYWNYLAEKENAALPYALNALLEIDLQRGLAKFIQVYSRLQKKRRAGSVDWEVVFQLAVDRYGGENVGEALDEALSHEPIAYEYFVRQVGKMPSLSKIGKRSIEDIASYAGGAIVKQAAPAESRAGLSVFNYEAAFATVISDAIVPKDKLTESWGVVGVGNEISRYPMDFLFSTGTKTGLV